MENLPDESLWTLRSRLRRRLVDTVKDRTGRSLDPEALTIGFARRFAPYKRGDLIFQDPDRAAAVLEQGAQLVFGGKAHPRDVNGQRIIAQVIKWSNDRRFRDRVVLLPDYDMRLGAVMTAGSDVWLNNPRRPREASGTSGQKVVLNGGLNLSVLDGWWPEGYDGSNGWAIGEARTFASTEEQDAADGASLYHQLETSVLPAWKDRDSRGIPRAWMQRIRRSLSTCLPQFSSHRMVRDYVVKLYEPAAAES